MEKLLERNKIINEWKRIIENNKGQIGYKLVEAEYESITKGINTHVFIDKYGDTYIKKCNNQIEIEENELMIYSFNEKNKLETFLDYTISGNLYTIIKDLELEKELQEFEENNKQSLYEFYKVLDENKQKMFLKSLISKHVDNYINYSLVKIREFLGPQIMYIVK
jgi:hypothetical protein